MLIRLATLSLLILWLGGCNKQAGDEDNQDNVKPSTEETPNGTATPNGTTPNEEGTDSYTLEIGTVQLRAGLPTQTVEVIVKKDDKPVEADHSLSGELTCQAESKAEGTTDAQGKVILSFTLKPSESETCAVRVDFDTGEGYRIAKEKKDLQVAGLRDLLQVANNGAFSFKGTAPQGYTITTANCGDNAGMVKWTSDNVVTPITEVTDLSDVYLYGNIANCEFYLDDEEVAKPDYSKIYIKFLAMSRASGSTDEGAMLQLMHGYVNAGNTSIVLVVYSPDSTHRFTEVLSISGNRHATSAQRSSINDIAWLKHNTGLLRWVVSRTHRTGHGW